MSPNKQGNSNFAESSASQHNQQSQTLPISKELANFIESKKGSASQQNQQGDLIDLNAPEVQTVQEGSGSRYSQWEADYLAFTGNQSFEQRQQKNEFFKLLKKSVEDFADWPTQKQALAISSVGAIVFAALPILAIALPLAATGAVVSLALFFAVKAVSYAFQGLKWSGEKVVKGLGYVAKQAGEGAKKGYEDSRDSLKRGYGHSKEKIKERASSMLNATADKLYRLAGETNYLNEIKKFTPEELKKVNEIRENMKTIFADTENSSKLVKNILSEISAKIDLKIAEEKSAGQTEHVTDLKWQKKFVNNLTLRTLEKLLTERSLPKESYLIDSIFSEHYGEIKDIIREERFHASVRRNNTAEGKAKKPSSLTLPESKSSSVRSTSSLPNSGSLNSLNSVSTDGSTAELLSPTEHKKAKWSFFSFPRIGKSAKENTTEVGYQAFSEVKTAKIGANCNPSQASASIPVSIPAVPSVEGPPKPHRDPSNSLSSGVSDASFSSTTSRLSGSESTSSFGYRRNSDSGMGSSDSSLRHSGLKMQGSEDEINKVKNGLKRRNSLQDGEFIKPSTKMTVHAEVHQHDTTVESKGKYNACHIE
ncbi:actin-bundling T4SS effector WalE1 family protein [Wolbachia endosymbiont of Folsomia candida]|uniref:actin-bundling T4SS effector WalE1 family protein n=1 Tax=Wolbachia endosymbiont of Folsomia candida TaxID=169402 RepID=UPI000A7CFAD6|nr:hypothetical protein [Wolbachia endosymbiont of Folsomia candida]APR98044.1 hypothetical protein ASM33_01855 [Wolbachia endosymbiont of Folsomia candida]